jgi:uncharacterized protein YlzI (FlbEa/FlbD family)
MKFIRLTKKRDGETVLINPEKIEAVEPYSKIEPGSSVWFEYGTKGRVIEVFEDKKEIENSVARFYRRGKFR